jgi:hypothetical protein
VLGETQAYKAFLYGGANHFFGGVFAVCEQRMRVRRG